MHTPTPGSCCGPLRATTRMTLCAIWCHTRTSGALPLRPVPTRSGNTPRIWMQPAVILHRPLRSRLLLLAPISMSAALEQSPTAPTSFTITGSIDSDSTQVSRAFVSVLSANEGRQPTKILSIKTGNESCCGRLGERYHPQKGHRQR